MNKSEVAAAVAALREGEAPDEELRESLRAHGWVPEFPAIQDEHGVTLVGNRRLRLAGELGIKPIIQVLEIGSGDDADVRRVRLAVASNVGGRPITVEDRKRLAAHLFAKDWTQQRIAEALGVSQQTISADLRGLPTTGKPPARPKGGRPKVQRAPRYRKVTEEQAEAVAEKVLDHGQSLRQAAESAGVSEQIVKVAVAREAGRREGPPPDPSMFSPTKQKQFDAAIARHKRQIEEQLRSTFSRAVDERVKERLQDLILPDWRSKVENAQRVLNARKGIMKRDEYRLVLACLHPDRSMSDEKLRAAFESFKKLEIVLCSAKELPLPPSAVPRTFEEWEKAAKAAKQARTKHGTSSVPAKRAR